MIIFVIACVAVYFAVFYFANDKSLCYMFLKGEGYEEYHGNMKLIVDKAIALPYENVWITAFDGKKLHGRLYLQNADAPLHIQFHGYMGDCYRDLGAALLLVHERGENALLIDERSHGQSDGHTITFGINERKDLIKWVDFAIGKLGSDVKIYLEGISMGAATVLMASNMDLPDNVKGIWADCPYSTPFGIIAKVARERVGIISKALYPAFVASAYVFGRFNLLESTALKSVKETKLPISIIHGDADRFVPCEMSRQIKKANPDKVTLTEVEGAAHGMSYFKDNVAFKKAFDDFIKSCNS